MKRLFSIWIFTLVGVVQIFAQPFAFDFSYVGYQQSEKGIPDADVVVFVKWKDGDQSARIQKAIDFVSARKVDKKTGLRGAVLLDKGVFELSQPLRIQTSGVAEPVPAQSETGALLHPGLRSQDPGSVRALALTSP